MAAVEWYIRFGLNPEIVAPTALEACRIYAAQFQAALGGVPRFASLGSPMPSAEAATSWFCSAVTDGEGGIQSGGGDTVNARPVVSPPGVPGGLPTAPDILPCPKSILTAPAERRLLSDVPGPRQSRGIQREYIATERIEWPPLTQAQADRLYTWWALDLMQGGAWFAADHWPIPQTGRVLRRFIGAPRWSYIHAGTEKRMWSVSAECELRETPSA